MPKRVVAFTALAMSLAVGIVGWIVNAPVLDHWLAIHTGTVNEAGPYYGFWSGFGSDLTEFGIIGAIGTATYQVVRKYNCHEPGCWRIGNHAAAGGRFLLCYRHHPDYHGIRPTTEMIARLHEDYVAREASVSNRLREIHDHLSDVDDPHADR